MLKPAIPRSACWVFSLTKASLRGTFRITASARRCAAVLVMEADDVEETHERPKAAGARIVNPPTRWTVPSPGGGDLEIYSMSMFDPEGIYSEISQSR